MPTGITPSIPSSLPVAESMTLARPLTVGSLFRVYRDLSKARLSALVLVSAASGMFMAPGSIGVGSAVVALAGTALCVGSANTFNQWAEWPFDAQMARTRNRPLVRYAVTPLHAFSLGTGSAIAGVALLASVSPPAAFLGAANVLLYALVYTPSKRLSIVNTWFGALVGAIPPLLGWAAVTCSFIHDATGGWLLASILFAWQFPHFNSLSWRLRDDYTRGGYRMMAVLNPTLCTRTALRYALVLTPICSLAIPYIALTTPAFAITSLIPNLALARDALAFHRTPSDASSRKLFFTSLWHLPLLIVLLAIHKHTESDDAQTSKKWTDRFLKDSALFDGGSVVAASVSGGGSSGGNANTITDKTSSVVVVNDYCIYEQIEKLIGRLVLGLGHSPLSPSPSTTAPSIDSHTIVESSTTGSGNDSTLSIAPVSGKEADGDVNDENSTEHWSVCGYTRLKKLIGL